MSDTTRSPDNSSGCTPIDLTDAPTLPVRTAQGALVTGYGIRDDAVLVVDGPVELPLWLVLETSEVEVLDVLSSAGDGETASWQALTVPSGTIPADLIIDLPDDDPVGPRVPFWCRLFRQLC